MSKESVAEAVTNIISPLFHDNAILSNYELIDVEYKKEGVNWFLRIYIDNNEGITLDDCQLVSKQVEDVIDRHDPVPTSYFLEVSSPGIERPLKKVADFEKFTGKMVKIKTYAPLEGQKEFKGQLKGITDNCIVLEKENKNYKIPFEQMASANLTIEE